MKSILVLLTFAGFLNSCTTTPPLTGSIVTDQGEFRLAPDGRVEITVNLQPTK